MFRKNGGLFGTRFTCLDECIFMTGQGMKLLSLSAC